MHVHEEIKDKVEPKSLKCIFAGYGYNGKMEYHLWDLESQKIVHIFHVIFNESKMHKSILRKWNTNETTTYCDIMHTLTTLDGVSSSAQSSGRRSYNGASTSRHPTAL